MSDETNGRSTASSAVSPTDDGAEPASARAKPLPLRLPVVVDDGAAPALVPARMINEVLYCERLLYLEYVQGEWADNVYTVDGQVVHRRVNEQVKALKPAPAADEPSDDKPYLARSVWLSSEQLGITAKIDLVEVDGGRVVPVECVFRTHLNSCSETT